MRWNGNELETTPIHLERTRPDGLPGAPLCSASPEGAQVTDQPVHVTCSTCLVEIGILLSRQTGVSA